MEGWQITIHSLLELYNHLKTKYDFNFILTRRLNQDCLENFFGSVRQQHGNAVNPTPIQFCRAFKKLFLLKFLHTEGMNSADDFGHLLTDLASFSENQKQLPSINIQSAEPFNV